MREGRGEGVECQACYICDTESEFERSTDARSEERAVY